MSSASSSTTATNHLWSHNKLHYKVLSNITGCYNINIIRVDDQSPYPNGLLKKLTLIKTSPPSARVAAMRSMQRQNCKTTLKVSRNIPQSSLNYPKNLDILETPLKLFIKHSLNFTTLKTPLKQPSIFLETHLKLS